MAKFTKSPGFNFLPESQFQSLAQSIMPEWEANYRTLNDCILKSGAYVQACVAERNKALTLIALTFCKSVHDDCRRCQQRVMEGKSYTTPTFADMRLCFKEQNTMLNCINVYDQKMLEYAGLHGKSNTPLPPRLG